MWGTVCDTYWSIDDAKVACHQLGLPNELVVAHDGAYFGRGTGPVWLNGLECDGKEDDIAKCKHRGWGESDCEHERDAGLQCSVCSKPDQLGLEFEVIKDAQITSSTAYNNYEPYEGRLNHPYYWSAINRYPNPWIQVDFVNTVTITKVLMQGSGSSMYKAYVGEVEIQTGDSEDTLTYIREDGDVKVFTANDDINSVVELPLGVPITARYLRINPVNCNNYCSLRFDVVGCSSLNECDDDAPCDQHATCTDLDDGYKCSCKSGFVGNGFQCREIPTTAIYTTSETTQATTTASVSSTSLPDIGANADAINIGVIAGAPGGGIALIILTLLLVGCICRKRRSPKVSTLEYTESPNNELEALDTHAETTGGNVYSGIDDHDNGSANDHSNEYANYNTNEYTYADSSNSHPNVPITDDTYAQLDENQPNSLDSTLHVHPNNNSLDNIYADADQQQLISQDYPRSSTKYVVYADIDREQANSNQAVLPNTHHNHTVQDLIQSQPDSIPCYAQVKKPKQQQPDSLRNNDPQTTDQYYGNIEILDDKSHPRKPLQTSSKSGWEDNTLYDTSNTGDGQLQFNTPRVPMATESVAPATRNSEVWMDNSLYATSDEFNESVQPAKDDTQQAHEGWVNNSIYDV